MVERLVRGTASVTELARPFDMTLPTVVQHLGVLETAGIVSDAVLMNGRSLRSTGEWCRPGECGSPRVGGVDFLGGVAEETRTMQTNHELLGRMACPTACLAVQVDERPEAAWLATDDRHHERQSEHARSNERLRAAADAEPERQRRLHR